MNKLKSKLILTTLSLTLLPIVTVEAANVANVVPTDVPSTIDIPKIITAAMNWAFGLLIVLAAAFILYAAYLYLIAGGKKEEDLEKAKNVILYAVVAIVIAFISRGLVSIVQNLLTP